MCGRLHDQGAEAAAVAALSLLGHSSQASKAAAKQMRSPDPALHALAWNTSCSGPSQRMDTAPLSLGCTLQAAGREEGNVQGGDMAGMEWAAEAAWS